MVVDTGTYEVEVIPLRSAGLHVNVTGILNSTMGVSAIGVPGEADPANGLFVFDITLTHPFAVKPQLAGFDVKGILMTPGSLSISPLVFADLDETRLENADGYTRWWNPSEFTEPGMFGYVDGVLANAPGTALTATINPYKYFADVLGADDPISLVPIEPLDSDLGRGVFAAGNSNTRRYRIRFPMNPDPQIVFGYAIDASWDFPSPNPPSEVPDSFPIKANQPEAYDLAMAPRVNTLYYDSIAGIGGGILQVQVDVHDWQGQLAGDIQGEVEVVKVFAPDLYTGAVDGVFLDESPIKATYIADLYGAAVPTGTGEALVAVRVRSMGGPAYDQGVAPAPPDKVSAWEVITVDIPELPGCVADSNNSHLEAVDIGLTEGTVGQVCQDVDGSDYFRFEIPVGYDATGDITLYCDKDLIELQLCDWNMYPVDYFETSGGTASFDLSQYPLIGGTYYLSVRTNEFNVALYHLQMNVDLVPKTDDIIEGEVTPEGLHCNPNYVWLNGNYVVFLGWYGLWVFDIADPGNPTLAGSETFTEYFNIRRVTYEHPYMYITENAFDTSALHLIDLTDIASPVLHRNLMTFQHANDDITMNSEHLFVLDADTICRVYSYASDPTNPTLVNQIEPAFFATQLALYDPEGPNTHLLIVGGAEVRSYDVEDIGSIAGDGSYTVPSGLVYDVDSNEDYVYVLERDCPTGYLHVLHQATGSLDWLGSETIAGCASRLEVSDSKAFIDPTDAGLSIVDISVPTAPSLIGAFITTTRTREMAVDSAGDYLYVVLRQMGYEIYDVSVFPVGLMHFPMLSNDPRAAVAIKSGIDDYLVVLDAADLDHTYLKTIDITDPANASIVAALSLPSQGGDRLVQGPGVLAVESGAGAFTAVDAASPWSLVLGDSDTLSGYIYGMGMNGTNLYISNFISPGNYTFEVYDISNPYSISNIGSVPTSSIHRYMAFKDNYMYARTDHEIDIYDITLPGTPVYVDTFTAVEDYPDELLVSGDYLYVNTHADFEIFDVSTPSAPVVLGTEFLFGSDAGRVFDIDSQHAFVHGDPTAFPAVVSLWPANDPSKVLTMDYPYGGSEDVLVWNEYLYMLSVHYGIRIFDLY